MIATCVRKADCADIAETVLLMESIACPQVLSSAHGIVGLFFAMSISNQEMVLTVVKYIKKNNTNMNTVYRGKY